MSTKSSVLDIDNIHIYHEWDDGEFIYINGHKLCSLETWYKIVRYIKNRDIDISGHKFIPEVGKH